MIATFRGYSFNTKWVESVTPGGPAIRVKRIRYPGVKGSISLNMRNAEREIVQTGTIRMNEQSALSDTQAVIISLCDGESGDLVVHGTTYTTTYADTLNFGTQFQANGLGGASVGTYFGLPYTITYVQTNP